MEWAVSGVSTVQYGSTVGGMRARGGEWEEGDEEKERKERGGSACLGTYWKAGFVGIATDWGVYRCLSDGSNGVHAVSE